jgi:pyruvate dehydrogenase E1 component alpha subunit
MEIEFNKELDEAIKFAEESPFPDVSALYENVYIEERPK